MLVNLFSCFIVDRIQQTHLTFLFLKVLRNLATENDLLIVATACTKHETVELFSLNTGERFFGHIEGITELSPVSY